MDADWTPQPGDIVAISLPEGAALPEGWESGYKVVTDCPILRTQAELDALPVGAVVMTLWDDGPIHAVMQKYSDGWYGFPSKTSLHPLGSGSQWETVALLWPR
jgi:hypothetical protein